MHATINTHCRYYVNTCTPLDQSNASIIHCKSLQSDRSKMKRCENINIRKISPEVHIKREFHTYPENFKSLAIIVLTGQCIRSNTKDRKPLILELGHYYIVGTLKNALLIKLALLLR